MYFCSHQNGPRKEQPLDLRAIKSLKLSVVIRSFCVKLSWSQRCKPAAGTELCSMGQAGRHPGKFATQIQPTFQVSLEIGYRILKYWRNPVIFFPIHAEKQVPQQWKSSLIQTIIGHHKGAYSHTRAGNLCLVLNEKPRSQQLNTFPSCNRLLQSQVVSQS